MKKFTTIVAVLFLTGCYGSEVPHPRVATPEVKSVEAVKDTPQLHEYQIYAGCAGVFAAAATVSDTELEKPLAVLVQYSNRRAQELRPQTVSDDDIDNIGIAVMTKLLKQYERNHSAGNEAIYNSMKKCAEYYPADFKNTSRT